MFAVPGEKATVRRAVGGDGEIVAWNRPH